MNKLVMWISISIFGLIGAYIPALWGAGMFSVWSIVGSVVGSFFGVYVAYKLSQYM